MVGRYPGHFNHCLSQTVSNRRTTVFQPMNPNLHLATKPEACWNLLGNSILARHSGSVCLVSRYLTHGAYFLVLSLANRLSRKSSTGSAQDTPAHGMSVRCIRARETRSRLTIQLNLDNGSPIRTLSFVKRVTSQVRERFGINVTASTCTFLSVFELLISKDPRVTHRIFIHGHHGLSSAVVNFGLRS